MSNEIKITGMRKIIAERMAESFVTSPRVTYTVSMDMTNLLKFKDKMNTEWENEDVSLSVNHLLVYICGKTLSEFPNVNGSYSDEVLTLHDSINIGMAVEVDGGLIVPNVKDVQDKDLLGVARETDRIIKAAKNKKLELDDITGGTFTITNLGTMGVESFTPIINQPELAILGVNKMIKTPICGEDDNIVIRPIVKYNLVADHRILDGAYAARVLAFMKSLIENPEGL